MLTMMYKIELCDRALNLVVRESTGRDLATVLEDITDELEQAVRDTGLRCVNLAGQGRGQFAARDLEVRISVSRLEVSGGAP